LNGVPSEKLPVDSVPKRNLLRKEGGERRAFSVQKMAELERRKKKQRQGRPYLVAREERIKRGGSAKTITPAMIKRGRSEEGH